MTGGTFGLITPAFLQSLLASKFPELRINSIHIDSSIHGTATKVKVTLDANGPGPRSMWVKAGWEDSSEVLRKVGIFSREPRVYAELLPQLGLEVPTCYGATWDDVTMDGIVVLEDLGGREAHFNSPLEPLPPKSVANLLSLLAKMHASSHSSGWLGSHNWLRPLFWDSLESGSYLAHVSSAATLEGFLAMPRGTALPQAAQDASAIAAAMTRTVCFGRDDDQRCMLHGDAHIGNSYSLPNGTLGLLDWQCVWNGGWAFDVAYLIGSSLSPEDRRSHEAGLLQHYLDKRTHRGWSAPSLAHVLDRYRRYLAYGLTVWLTNLPSFQPEEFNAAVASRFAQAMLDHGLFDDR